MPGPTVQQFIEAARFEVGYTESPPGSNKTKFAAEAGHANGYAWCHTFLVAVAKRTGLVIPDGVAWTAYTPAGLNQWRQAERLHSTPQVGDWAYIDFPDSTYRVQHVALVTAIHSDGTISTIEGNTSSSDAGSQSNGGGVFARRRHRSVVKGYGRPAYASAIPVVIVKQGSPEHVVMSHYPELLGKRGVRTVHPDPSKDVHAAGNPDDIAFGVRIWGAKHQIVGTTRYDTLRAAVAFTG